MSGTESGAWKQSLARAMFAALAMLVPVALLLLTAFDPAPMPVTPPSAPPDA